MTREEIDDQTAENRHGPKSPKGKVAHPGPEDSSHGIPAQNQGEKEVEQHHKQPPLNYVTMRRNQDVHRMLLGLFEFGDVLGQGRDLIVAQAGDLTVHHGSHPVGVARAGFVGFDLGFQLGCILTRNDR